MAHPVALIPGDGIGPEITEAVLAVLNAAEVDLEWHRCQAGLAALEAGDRVMPEEMLETIRRCGIALKGPCTTPVGEGFASVNV